MPLETPAHQNADFFRAILPFQPDLDLDWLLALTCTASKTALADVRPVGFQVTTQYCSVVASPAQCDLAIACGCDPAELIREAAATGDLNLLGHLCDTYHDKVPTGLAAWAVGRAPPETVANTITWLHGRGHQLGMLNLHAPWMTPALLNLGAPSGSIGLPDQSGFIRLANPHEWAGEMVKTRPLAYVLEAFKPASAIAHILPTGPSNWVLCSLYEHHRPHRCCCLEYVQAFHGLGWDMWAVPQYCARTDDHTAVLEWLRTEGVLDGLLSLADHANLIQAAGDRKAEKAVAWLEAYWATRTGEPW